MPHITSKMPVKWINAECLERQKCWKIGSMMWNRETHIWSWTRWLLDVWSGTRARTMINIRSVNELLLAQISKPMPSWHGREKFFKLFIWNCIWFSLIELRFTTQLPANSSNDHIVMWRVDWYPNRSPSSTSQTQSTLDFYFWNRRDVCWKRRGVVRTYL